MRPHFYAALLLSGCAALPNDVRQPITWHHDSPPAAEFYVWVTTPHAQSMCRLAPNEGGGCAPVRLREGIVPPGARRISDDSEVSLPEVGKIAPLCYIYSTHTWAEAIWADSAYLKDDLRHLEHEKRHCGWNGSSWNHQPLNYLMGRKQ